MRWQNVKGSDRYPVCRCLTWKQHWLNFSGATSCPEVCGIYGCSDVAEVGAHVYNSNPDASKEEYILPMCKKHNGQDIEFDLAERLAPANRSVTCDTAGAS